MRRIRLGLALALVALLVSAGVALASVLGDTGFYKGSTSQGKPFSFKLTQNGRRITKGIVTWRADCQSGQNIRRTDSAFTANVSSSGVFAVSGSYDVNVGNGIHATVNAKVSGHFASQRRAVGTFRGRVTFTDSTGQVVDHCDSGNVNWHASHQ